MTGLGHGLLLFLLWMCMVQNVTCSYADILHGQCYAFCLDRQEFRLQQQASAEDSQLTKEEVTIKKCRRDRRCRWCLSVCQRPKNKYLDHESCLSDCEDIRTRGRREEAVQACRESCDFLKESSQEKYGSCPAQSLMERNRSESSNTCTHLCKRDLECDRNEKCCMKNCNQQCVSPSEIEVFPPKAGKLKFKVQRDGSVHVRWGKRPEGVYEKPVVYVLRWWCHSRIGVKFAVTTRSKIKVRGMRPAESCKFMVASANKLGSLGFSDLREYRKKLLTPSAPLNLEVVKNKLHGRNKVDITIRWEPPRFLDGLPLVRYLILWSDGLPQISPEYHRLRMNQKTVRADRTMATIPALKPGTTYFVQVKAVVKWSGRAVNGKPVSIYTETFSSPQSAGLDNGESIPEEIVSAEQHIYNITVEDAVFKRSHLKANVTWSVKPESNIAKYMLYWIPDICNGEALHRKTRTRSTMEATTHKQKFELYNLKSNCLYELRLYTVTYSGMKDSGRKHLFQTPKCHDTTGSENAKCPPKVSPPPPPTSLSIRFTVSAGCMCQAVISWMWPEESKPPNKFSVMWGLSREPVDSSYGPIVYQTAPFSIHIPTDDNELCMTNLEPSRHYTVQVTSHADKLQSSPAVKHFMTPHHIGSCAIKFDDDMVSDIITEENQKAAQEPKKDVGGGVSHNKPHYLWLPLLSAAVVLVNVMHGRL